jgi:3-oxoadipate enol-lactonase
VRVALDGFEAYYEDRGSGPPLVLVHGLGASTRMWDRVAGPLSEQFRVVAYDLRGLGRSETPPPPYSLDQLVADLHGLLDALALGRVALAGHSLGGAIVLTYAIRHPDRVGALVGIAAPSLTTDEQRGLLAERARAARAEGMQALAELHAQGGLPEGFEAAHPDDTAFYKSIIASGDPDGYAALCGVTGDLDLRPGPGGIRAPTLLLEGELDRVVRPESVRATAAAIPGCEYVELPGCGHIVPLERPAELVSRLREFVGRSAELATPA